MNEIGLWCGLVVGAGLQAVVLLAMLARWDWGKEAARVQYRMAKGGRGAGGEGGPALAPAH
jgi:hypothetical protein